MKAEEPKKVMKVFGYKTTNRERKSTLIKKKSYEDKRKQWAYGKALERVVRIIDNSNTNNGKIPI